MAKPCMSVSVAATAGQKSPLVLHSLDDMVDFFFFFLSQADIISLERKSCLQLNYWATFPISASYDEQHTCITSFTAWSLQQDWLLQLAAISYLQSASAFYNNVNTMAVWNVRISCGKSAESRNLMKCARTSLELNEGRDGSTKLIRLQKLNAQLGR